MGLLSALVRPGDLVVSDALNHASIIDGCRLSKARVAVVPHLDAGAVALTLEQPAAHRWVVTESVFSMDGDTPDLVELRRVCDRAGAFLVVDEAHAIGVLGPEGAGLCRSVGVEPDVMVGTLGKALGLQGAFVGGRAPIRDYLWNRARSFVFSTGLSPALAAAVPDRVARVREMEGARETICARGRRLAALFGLRRRVDHPVVPWLLGDEQRALCVETRLLEHGFFAGAIRPPTVPAGTARIRLATGVGVREDDFERAFDLIGALRSEL